MTEEWGLESGEYDMAEIFDEIHNLLVNRDRRPKEFTCSEYAAHHGKTPAWARVELEKVVKMGGAERREAVVNGHRSILYRKTES